jgi:urea transport system ATP-binding protein
VSGGAEAAPERDTERDGAVAADAAAPADESTPAAAPVPPRFALWVDDVSVSFDGFKALDRVTMLLEPGELRCIIGPNGAGKTTLMDVITGKTRPDSGAVYLESQIDNLTVLPEWRIAEMGVGRKFQRPTVFQGHTVFENCELALRGPKGVFRTLLSRLSKAQRTRLDEVLEIVGLSELRHRPAGLLAHGQKQWLEIGMLLAQDPKVLLIDEPVAGMTQPEMERTAALLRSLAGQRTVVVVEHDMEFVRSNARKVTVLHEGRILAEGPMDEIQRNDRVVEVYLGT